MFTLDASVLMRRINAKDPATVVCNELLEAIRLKAIPLVEPLLVLPEVAGAFSRLFRDPMRGRVYAELLRDLPNTTYVPLDAALAQVATELAADRFLRGADAVYAAVALRYGTTLVTLDDEHHRHLSGVLAVQMPSAALATIVAEPF
ncbi:type II toxin-antitoxin system VapC family toxin [Chloroflexus sp.]|uniref:type II toxin-antitoxin system VapC family toxin n=1 Tax=Chloroflexus sp. TaxID=1904827 RepID=UPI00298F0EAD|nr:PIN domain-containing protein [Chloroflexus sp.]MDW8403349.1 PIN domain-containing protein [Chloroflexus sp.]